MRLNSARPAAKVGQYRLPHRGVDPRRQHHESRAQRRSRGGAPAVAAVQTRKPRPGASPAQPSRKQAAAQPAPAAAAPSAPPDALHRTGRRTRFGRPRPGSRRRRPRPRPPHRRQILRRRGKHCCRPRAARRGRPHAKVARHVPLRPHRQSRRNRLPHRAHRQAPRDAHDRGLFGRRRARAACARCATRRTCIGPAQAREAICRSTHDRRRAARRRRMRSSGLRLSVRERGFRRGLRARPVSSSSGRRRRRSAPWALRIAPRR